MTWIGTVRFLNILIIVEMTTNQRSGDGVSPPISREMEDHPGVLG